MRNTAVADGVAPGHIRYGGRIIRAAALLLPREHRAHWAQDVVTTMSEYGDNRLAKLTTLLDQAVRFPWHALLSWVEKANATTLTVAGVHVDAGQLLQDSWKAVVSKATVVKAAVARRWSEWKVALLLALLAAFLMEPVMYILTFWLHHHGLVWPWEK
ncbi:hypothetical protein AB0D11_43630 [Streptomyces monashensis]|uniref:hypothetical protein n=1 Tax=Streptomyces monashensis TaxID=1678012 RepID=UPI0033DD342D